MAIIFKKISDINNSSLEEGLLNCLQLWNEEMGYVYPISSKAFYQNVINYNEKNGLIAYEEDKVIGFIIIKWFDDKSIIDYSTSLFISLFYVSKKHRKKGIGTKLFDFAEIERKGRKLLIGKDIFNFFPGVATDFDNLTDIWLEKRGFHGNRYTHDLIAYDPKIFPIKNTDVEYVYCSKKMREKLIDFLKQNNWHRWALEAKLYFENGEENNGGFLIGIKNNEIISFAKINTHKMQSVGYNVMWQNRFSSLGGIGPLGVSSKYRKQGLGLDLISKAIMEIKKMGISPIIIDWTGLMELYGIFNFEVWKSYKYMEK